MSDNHTRKPPQEPASETRQDAEQRRRAAEDARPPKKLVDAMRKLLAELLQKPRR